MIDLRSWRSVGQLSAAWSLEDGDDPEEALAAAARLRPHL